VRTSAIYLAFYVAMGVAWLGLAVRLFPFFGLNPRDDVVERRNRAAMYAISGGLIGITLCFAGGNIGEGPGWWVVVISAGISTMALFAIWVLLELFSKVVETITIDRDESAGLRLAGFLIAGGLIFGRAVAGNWVSLDGTIADFIRFAWPIIFLIGAAIAVERIARPTLDQPNAPMFGLGVVPAATYVCAALVIVYFAR
jgi:uncharacterized membrane protein YjfL (UPF0719 family)